MTTTKVFKNGSSLAVRLPKKFALPVGEVSIEERDGEIIIKELDDKGWPVGFFESLAPLGDLEIPERPKDSRSIEL